MQFALWPRIRVWDFLHVFFWHQIADGRGGNSSGLAFPMPAAQAPRVLREQPAGEQPAGDSSVKAPKGNKSILLSSQTQRV